MCLDTHSDDHTSRLEYQITVMRSHFPSTSIGRDTRINPDVIIFENRDVYVGVHEHSLNVNADVTA